MMRSLLGLLLLTLAAGLATCSSGEPGAGTGPAAAPAAGAGGPVVVELFTSQGCSSCPPADRLLSQLAADPELAGRVLPLAYHVDYWDRLGWRDPFSAAEWSARQERYAHAFGSSRIYTPQIVIGGAAETVGSRGREVREEIDRALADSAPARVEVALGAVRDGRLPVTVIAVADPGTGAEDGEAAGGDGTQASLDVQVALWQDGLVTEVGRGENAAKTLRNDRVVRHLVHALELPADGRPHTATVELPFAADARRGDLGVVAFVQHPRTLRILGAGSARPQPAR